MLSTRDQIESQAPLQEQLLGGILVKTEAYIDTLRLLIQPQELQFTSKQHPELPENGIVWKSDNQGFKEATFIHTGRRSGDAEMGGEAWRCGVAQRGGRSGGPTCTCGG